MNGQDLLQKAKRRFIAELESRDRGCKYLNAEVVVSSPLSSRDVIGDPGRDDFPLLRGKEVLMQAVYEGSTGQAFTAASGSFQGSLKDVLELPLKKPFERAVFISTMNAVLRHLGLVEKTVHCKNDGPKGCALRMGSWINEQGADRVGLVGLQPAILEALVDALGADRVMVSDLAEIGKVRYGVRVLDGMESAQMFENCQMILITGSTLVNGTIDGLMDNALRYERRVVFYGTTISGASYLLGLERLCFCST
ncbi:MAG: DUF364 domain-containing protein [Methanotrichaceae archaeon]